ncbi:hypothetical protein D3C76_1393790 [compost metagenome]
MLVFTSLNFGFSVFPEADTVPLYICTFSAAVGATDVSVMVTTKDCAAPALNSKVSVVVPTA